MLTHNFLPTQEVNKAAAASLEQYMADAAENHPNSLVAATYHL